MFREMRHRSPASSVPFVVVCAAAALGACSGPGRQPRPEPDYGTVPTDTVPAFYGSAPHNIFMVSMDTFRKDHLDRAPFINAVGQAGFRADDHIQCSNWTYAATSCTLAGRHNEQAGMIPQLITNFDGVWPVGTQFLAKDLGAAGYYSVIASTNGWLGPEWGNTGGYDQAFHPTVGDAYGAYEEGRERLDFALQNDHPAHWLLHVHLTEPHAAYDPPEAYLGALADLPPVPWDLTNRDEQYEVSRQEWPTMSQEDRDLLDAHLQARYEAELKFMDDQVFSMIADMDFDGLLDDTLVVFWTDHGEQFWEHGYQTHAYTLFREENDGILILWAKNIVPQVWTGPTSSIDLVPTLLSVLGLPIPPEVTGIPIGQAPDDRPRFANAIARLGGLSSVVKNHHKLIFSWLGGVKLFDLDADPGELNNLYDPLAPSDIALDLWSDLKPEVELQSSVAPEYGISWPTELP